MALTLGDLYQAIARNFGALYATGTATSGSTTTIVDTSNLPALAANDALNNGYAYVKTDAAGAHAAPEGQTRLITDFVQSTGTVTVGIAFSAAVGVGDTYVVCAGVPKATLADAAAQALRDAWPSFHQKYIDDTTVIAADTYAYDIPATIDVLDEVWIQGDAAASFYDPVNVWRRSVSGASTRQVVLDKEQEYVTDYVLRLVGRGPLDLPANDYAAITIQAEYEQALLAYVGYRGAELCHRWVSMRDGKNLREHLTMADMLGKEALKALRKGMPAVHGRLNVRLPEYWR